MLVFVLNAGSSSLKYQLINAETSELKASGLVERIGIDGILKHEIGENKKLTFELSIPTHKEAIELVLRILTNDETKVIDSIKEIEAIGHRIVHGGEFFKESTIITKDVIEKIEQLIPLAPLHNPANILGIKIIKPMIADIMAETKTLPAATSFAILANGVLSLVIRLTVDSIEVFTISKEITKAKHIRQIIHSIQLIL